MSTFRDQWQSETAIVCTARPPPGWLPAGAALAWPVLDARLLPGDPRILCVLHRGDSFANLKPDSGRVRVAAYRWNGFGFSVITDSETTRQCEQCLDVDGLGLRRKLLQ